MTEIEIEPEVSNIFSTNNTALYQCDRSESFILKFFEEHISFKIGELQAIRKKIRNIDLAQLFKSGTPDIEILNVPQCDRIFVLSILEILELKELFSGAFVMLELNSVIHREILRK
ncbi:hypothetical protein QQ008_12955 [Fulvivirgaceae bacterium BMA10]|uniref:Uncharacterized protein n=1 Tax=Splendidivirga corallicola TaxID=3051826 RepID=A0ABT8KNF9_9BACT|nr:hypothetical protein [Fulvivirgaceae bacterium BMA10]